MLRRLLDQTIALSAHRLALPALALIAFAESSVFPIPPDVLLVPMVLAARRRAWVIAGVCTGASVLGGLAGYGIGAFLFEAVGRPLIEFYQAMEQFDAARTLYNEHGALIVFTAGFSPIPYKIFTIASGVSGMEPVSFAMASLVGRGLRFFIVAALLWRYGEPILAFVEKRLGALALAFCVLLAGGFLLVGLVP